GLGGSNRRHHHNAVIRSEHTLELSGGIICQEIAFLAGQRQDGDAIRGKLSGDSAADKPPGPYNHDPARLSRDRIPMLKHVVKLPHPTLSVWTETGSLERPLVSARNGGTPSVK